MFYRYIELDLEVTLPIHNPTTCLTVDRTGAGLVGGTPALEGGQLYLAPCPSLFLPPSRGVYTCKRLDRIGAGQAKVDGRALHPERRATASGCGAPGSAAPSS